MDDQFNCSKCGETVKDTDYDWKDGHYWSLKRVGLCEKCARGD